MASRRVLVFNHFARTPSAPGGTRHVELFTRLKEWDARIVASNRTIHGGACVQSEGIVDTVWVVPPGASPFRRIANWTSYCLTALFRGLRIGRVDIIVGSSPHILAPLAALMLARIRRAPFVLEVRDIWPRVFVEMGAMSETSLQYRLLAAVERFIYRKASAIVVLAEGTEDYLVDLGISRDRLCFIPNGADPLPCRSDQERTALRQRYGFDGTVAVYTGAHGPANGLDLLLSAAKDLQATDPGLLVVLVGDGVEKPRLQALAHELRLANVRFLDPVPKREIPDILGAADIGVHCLADVDLFRSGVSPNKIYDYMATGLPVVTNTPGEVASLVERAGAGVAVAPSKLSDGLRDLARLTADERRRLGDSGRHYLAENRSHTILASRLERLLTDLVSERGRHQ